MFSSLTTKEQVFRKMGYYDDQDGIMRRYRREGNAWKEHLDKTKAFIIKASSERKKDKVSILGSGWLLDVPITELSDMFAQVWLFDIRHPEEVKRKVSKMTNVFLVETDISGFVLPLYSCIQNSRSNRKECDVTTLIPQFDFDLKDFDFIVSCNILNQLDILLVDYVKRFIKNNTVAEDQLRKIIQENHVRMLPIQKSCLISDVEELSIGKNDHIQNQQSLVFAENMSCEYNDTWMWHFDNYHTYHPDYKTWFKVKAWQI
jgi:hypothetical protein